MLAEKQGTKQNMYVADYVVFDLETTGISCQTDQVVEISALRVRNGKVADEFSALVNPGIPIPYQASRVNHITDDMVKEKPPFKEVLADFLSFSGNDPLVGHNIHTFDMKFLYRDAGRFFHQTISNDYIDTLLLARSVLPQLKHHKLTDLASYYRIPSEGAHRALYDCHMTHLVYEFLRKELPGIQNEKTCPLCGSVMKRRSGRYGEFLGCSNFPRCRHTENL